MSETQSSKETATLGGGCFWCLEAVFDDLKGVISVESGYMGGARPNPTYEQVCGGRTGHAEVVQVTFDPAQITYRDLLSHTSGLTYGFQRQHPVDELYRRDEGLKAALNPAAGNLANDLRDLYAYMSMRLTYANLHSDTAAVEECQRLMQPIREAWASIAPAQNEQRVAA